MKTPFSKWQVPFTVNKMKLLSLFYLISKLVQLFTTLFSQETNLFVSGYLVEKKSKIKIYYRIIPKLHHTMLGGFRHLPSLL